MLNNQLDEKKKNYPFSTIHLYFFNNSILKHFNSMQFNIKKLQNETPMELPKKYFIVVLFLPSLICKQLTSKYFSK